MCVAGELNCLIGTPATNQRRWHRRPVHWVEQTPFNRWRREPAEVCYMSTLAFSKNRALTRGYQLRRQFRLTPFQVKEPMPHDYDPGYGAEPFRTLVNDHPDATVYPQSNFRTEW